MYEIAKTLSANDTAETGSHQAGILIPKEPQILSLFPVLDSSTKNPRVLIRFFDDGGCHWDFSFIYYNNKFFGGTRNEFRLTRMTGYIRQRGLVAGDEIIFSKKNDKYHVRSAKQNTKRLVSKNVLVLRAGWKRIQL